MVACLLVYVPRLPMLGLFLLFILELLVLFQTLLFDIRNIKLELGFHDFVGHGDPNEFFLHHFRMLVVASEEPIRILG